MNWDSYCKIKQYTIITLLNNLTASAICDKKWVEVNDLASGQYSVNKNILRLKTSMLILDLCNYSDAYIVVKGRITVADAHNANC